MLFPALLSEISSHDFEVAETLISVLRFVLIFVVARTLAEILVRFELPTILGELLAGVIIGAYLGWRRLTRPSVSAASEPPPSWDAAAALRALEVAGADAEQALLQVKAILRRFCAERFGVPAEVRTSEELLIALPGGHETLRPCLQDIDLALFGELPAADDGPALSRDRALVFVAEVEGGR